MTLFDMSKSLDPECQKKLTETRKTCMEILNNVPDEAKLLLYAETLQLVHEDNMLGSMAMFALLGYMETITNIAKKRVQENS